MSAGLEKFKQHIRIQICLINVRKLQVVITFAKLILQVYHLIRETKKH